MGIQGLSALIKEGLEYIHLSKLKGQRAAIDAMSFLYKGCYGYSYELNNGENTKQYMLFLLRIIRVVKSNGIHPLVIFDGRSLSAKDMTAKKREEDKVKNYNKAQKYMKEGNKNEALKYFSRCLRVKKDMIYDTIDMLRANQIDYMISPYEADSQVAYMVLSNQADFAITEDSDLICYGCPRTIFKLSLDSSGQYFDLNKYTESKEERNKLKNESLRMFLGQNQMNRIYICMMAGSDYIPNIQGIGLKRAIDLFYKCSTLQNVLGKLKMDKKMRSLIPKNYEQFVEKISLIFRHQRVYDLRQKKLIPMNPVDKENFTAEDEKLIGEEIDYFDEVTLGLRHIYTLEKRELNDIDMKTYFNSKFERNQFTIQQNNTNNKIQNDNIKNNQEQEAYQQYKVDPNQIKKLYKPSQIEELQKYNKKQEDELNEILDNYNIEYNDFDMNDDNNKNNNDGQDNDFENNNNNNEDDENFKRFGERYQYTEEYQDQKKIQQDYTSYFENLCNNFLNSYKSYLQNENTESNDLKTIQIVRRKSYQQNDQENDDNDQEDQNNNDEEDEENKNQNENNNVKQRIMNNNPFAIKSQKKNAHQPHSLEDMQLERKIQIPDKKVVINNEKQNKYDVSISSQQSIANSSSKKVTMKDFFSKKKK